MKDTKTEEKLRLFANLILDRVSEMTPEEREQLDKKIIKEKSTQPKAFLVKAFTKDKTQGNPAGVVLNADYLTDKQMQYIAKELGFSESAFVSKSDNADYKVRFFSQTQEVDFCGHATIAAFHTLVEQVELYQLYIGDKTKESVVVTQETKAGILPVICYKNGLVVMTQNDPKFFEPEKDKNRIAQLLGIDPKHILGYPLQTVSTGTPKLIISIDSLDTLFAMTPDLESIKTYCKETGAKGFYPFTTETKEKDSDFHARQFNPISGIDEDPITGVAAGALGCYILKHKLSKKKNFVIEQGYAMNKAGKIFVDVKKEVKVGGYAVTFGTKTFHL
ncbi:MAG: PhzF family phenazine biosynthesis isomerase [Patescibacteria group bacterium]